MEFNDHVQSTRGVDAPNAGGAAEAQPVGIDSPRLPDPHPVVYEAKQIDLVAVAMPVAGDVLQVSQLEIRELKGPAHMFTANLELAYQFRGIAYKPPGSFESQFQVVAGDILHDPRVMKLTQMIAFIAVYSWAAFENVLLPVKMNSYGQKVLTDLKQLQHRLPAAHKAFILWDEKRRRHVVSYQLLSAEETELIAKVVWPTKHEILDAVKAVAFDTVKALSEANEDLRNMLTAKEVR